MVRYLAAIACLSILGVSAAASFADLRPDARLHPAPWVLTWHAGMPNTFHLTGEDGTHLRLGSRALGIEEVGVATDSGCSAMVDDGRYAPDGDFISHCSNTCSKIR